MVEEVENVDVGLRDQSHEPAWGKTPISRCS